jgi:hypothetical protein
MIIFKESRNKVQISPSVKKVYILSQNEQLYHIFFKILINGVIKP